VDLNESNGNEGGWSAQAHSLASQLAPSPNPYPAPPASAPDPIAIFLNGNKIAWGSLINGQTWTLAEVVGNALGITIGWDGKAVLANGKTLTTMQIDSLGYVLVRDLATVAGAKIEWDGEKMIVMLTK
jgi:hypothetical protein